MMPYTPADPTARMNRAPTLRSAANRLTSSPKISTVPPKGMTAAERIAVTKTTTGAKRNTHLSAAAGTRSSLPSSLTASARGCPSPCQPVRVGPRRSWKAASTLRSNQVMYAMLTSSTFIMTKATMNVIQIGWSIFCNQPLPSATVHPRTADCASALPFTPCFPASDATDDGTRISMLHQCSSQWYRDIGRVADVPSRLGACHPHVVTPGRGRRPRVDCLLYTSDAADDLLCVDLGGR